ncbi:MAG: hypothetical protein ACRD0K_23905 [Egibacteraceae bacterium]
MPFTAHAAADGLFADADVVCLFGVGHDPPRPLAAAGPRHRAAGKFGEARRRTRMSGRR